jgi:general secretion pathway protein E
LDTSTIESSYLYRTLQNPKGLKIRKALGCAVCRDTGYKGRSAIAEILTIDDTMKDLLVQQAPISVVKKAARERGFTSLRDSAVALVFQGLTTIEEIDRVTPEEQAV